MRSWSRWLARDFFLVIAFSLVPPLHSSPPPSWTGVLRDSGSNPIGGATIKLFAAAANREYFATTSATGQFAFTAVAGGNYTLTVSVAGKIWAASDPVVLKDGATLTSGLQLSPPGQELRVTVAADAASLQASGGERLSAAVFAMDGADTTDPELGGATFSNFNVDAIQEVQSESGVMPADTGH